jgi:hypothetical protein
MAGALVKARSVIQKRNVLEGSLLRIADIATGLVDIIAITDLKPSPVYGFLLTCKPFWTFRTIGK